MTDPNSTGKPSSPSIDPPPATPLVPAELTGFLNALFLPDDVVLIRPIETWTEAGKKRSRVVYKSVRYVTAKPLSTHGRLWAMIDYMARSEKANLFFGVCPRFNRKDYDRAFQVRVVRVLWADLDHCTPEEALQRCEKAGLPRPSIVVRSGHGIHLYWLLAEPCLIDDAADPPPVRKEWVELPDGKKRPRNYVELASGGREYEFFADPQTGGDSKRKNPTFPDQLSAKAVYAQQVLQGIANRIGGDHTQDLSRLLRLPCTLNRKDERNGQEPVPCELVTCDPGLRYAFAEFEQFANFSSDRVRDEALAKIRLPKRKLTQSRLEKLSDHINCCLTADDRSQADFALCCFAIRQGLDKEEVWKPVAEVGKFGERGRAYFDQTWDKAEERVRKTIYDNLQRKAGANAGPRRKGTANERNGHDTATHPVKPTPTLLPSMDTDSLGVNEALDDPHRLARLFLCPPIIPCDVIPEVTPADLKLRFWRGEWVQYDGTAYRLTPGKEVEARLTQSVKAEFNRIIQNKMNEWLERRVAGEGDGDKGAKPPTTQKVTTKLLGDARQALRGLAILPATVAPPTWLNGPGPFPAGEVLAAQNALVHLPSLVANRDPFSCPPTLNFFSPNVLDYDFLLNAPAPEHWLAFLGNLWPDDPEAVALLQEWFGYSQLPDTAQQKILLVVGPKRSGKGTIARVLRALIGPNNVAGPTLSSLGTNFGLWPLLGKTVAIVSDARLSGGHRDQDVIVERLLSISGEDALTVDRKNMEPVTGKLACRFTILTNELPRLGDSSGALPSRFLMLHTPRSWYGQEDHGLTDRLLGELPAILLWAIEGWRRLRERGHFVQPESGAELLEEMTDLSSPVGAFLKECCLIGPEHQTAKAEIYTRFKRWCETKGVKNTPTESTFGRDLLSACPTLRTRRPREGESRQRVYQGIAVVPEPPGDPTCDF